MKTSCIHYSSQLQYRSRVLVHLPWFCLCWIAAQGCSWIWPWQNLIWQLWKPRLVWPRFFFCGSSWLTKLRYRIACGRVWTVVMTGLPASKCKVCNFSLKVYMIIALLLDKNQNQYVDQCFKWAQNCCIQISMCEMTLAWVQKNEIPPKKLFARICTVLSIWCGLPWMNCALNYSNTSQRPSKPHKPFHSRIRISSWIVANVQLLEMKVSSTMDANLFKWSWRENRK